MNVNISVPFLIEATGCPADKAVEAAAALGPACTKYRIATRERLAAFLAQNAHESESFSQLRESLNYTPARLLEVFGTRRITPEQAAQYGRTAHQPADQQAIANTVYGGAWGLKNLGNTQATDGWDFRGAGYMHHTGRDNYEQLAKLLGRGVTPEDLMVPANAADAAAAWWYSRGLNDLADQGDFRGITQVINGGQNGAADREQRWARVKGAIDRLHAEIFGPDVSTPSPPPKKTATDGASPLPGVPEGGETPPSAPAPVPERPRYMPAGEAGPEFFEQQSRSTTVEPTMLWGLAKTVINLFSPVVQEKIENELGRHTDKPEVASQVATAILDKLKTVTNTPTQIAAVAAATNPAAPLPRAAIQQVEDTTIDKLNSMRPILELLHTQDLEARREDTASMDAAARRGAAETWDMSRMLVIGAFTFLGMLTALVGGVAIAQVIMYETIGTEVWAQISGLIGFATGVGTTIFAYRFGTSRGSATKDVVINELSKRNGR